MAGLRRSSRSSRHGAKADLADAGPAPGALDPGPPHPGPPHPQPLLDLPFRVVEPAPAAGVSVVEVDLDRAGHRGRSHLSAQLPAHLPVQPTFAAPPEPAGPEDPAGGTEPRRRWPRRRRTSTGTRDPGVLDLPAPQGYVARRSPGKARRGWFATPRRPCRR